MLGGPLLGLANSEYYLTKHNLRVMAGSDKTSSEIFETSSEISGCLRI